VIMGVTMVTALLVVLGNLIADILYAVVDPRIQYGKT
jgi:peptide/nickel transport system permease protein